MRPITLRLSEDLIEELDAEADAAGISSRSEYIRYLLANRDQTTTATQSDTGQATSDADRVDDVSENISELGERLEVIEDRVADLETDVTSLQSSTTDDDTAQDSSVEARSEASSPGEGKGDNEDGVFYRLEDWLAKNGPDSESAQSILVDAARLLDERGPLQTGELRDALYEQYPDTYGSASALWSATVSRWYEDIPGFEKLDHGTYGFNREKLLDTL